MQDYQLSLDTIFRRAEQSSRTRRSPPAAPRPPHDVRRMGRADQTAGRRAGQARASVRDGRVGTFAWNSGRHLELYFAAPCTGRVLHTLNIRLFPDQVVYIANHAEDEVVFVDRSLLGLFLPLLDRLPLVRHVVVMDDCRRCARARSRTTRGSTTTRSCWPPPPVEFHVEDENQAAAMCYTSGTTGNPKGVVYSHRSTWLHSIGVLTNAGIGLHETDTVMPVVPMFHANAWGLAHAAPMAGASLVFPGPDMSPRGFSSCCRSRRSPGRRGADDLAGDAAVAGRRRTAKLRRIPCGGSAVPEALSEAFREKLGKPILQAWGMTETSPVATASHVPRAMRICRRTSRPSSGPGRGYRCRASRCASSSRAIEPLPWNDEATGELQVRGPWIAAEYYRPDEGVQLNTEDGWMKTGDVAAIDQFGSVRLVDRTKDLVKSGGEWISSVELENLLMGHPASRRRRSSAYRTRSGTSGRWRA